jgi:PKD repeat protein
MPTDWKWDFGDGVSGTGQNPDHVYHQPGVYSVRLIASDQYTTNSLTKKDYITVVNTPNADFTADATRGITPFNVHFSDKSTGNPTSWKWDFGDGATSTEQNPYHLYTTFGTSSTNKYTVTLTAINANGDDKVTKVDYITVTQTPIAEFTVDDRRGKAPFIVKFHDLSAGSPTKWFWDFGDASTSNEQNPTHLYPFEGSYDVRLTVSNQFGSDTVFKTGSTSQRNNAAPVALTDLTVPETTVSATQVPTTAATVLTTVPTTNPATPRTTQAPVSGIIPVAASVIGLLGIAVAKRK